MSDDISQAMALCHSLTQPDIDHFLSLGTPPLALARTWDGIHSPILRCKIVATGDDRFEFAEWMRNDPRQGAVIIPAHDRFGEIDDLIAWNRHFMGSWLGRAAVLGEEQLHGFRVVERFEVHESPREWLAAGRRGVVVIDEARAGELLRPVPMVAASVQHGRRLQKMCTAPTPRISVPDPQRRAAA